MEVLLEQECSTERQLDTYKSQLVLVERQLECGAGAADTADLQQLKDNLTELIALTEDALLELKKQRLLFSVESVETGKMPTAEEKEGEEGDGEDSDDLRGIKCQAPIEESWGAVNYHNAVILCREDADTKTAGEGEKEDTKVRVLFTHPTYKAMRPCPFFLEGRCRFESSVCKFSHGHVVSFSDLLTYQEPDYSLASIGGKCLAKHSDSLWYPAIISSLDEEFTVHFPSLNTTVQTPIENVVPQEGSESSGSGISSEEEEEAVVVEWIPSGPQRALGDWEKHTTGIGSKLMAKMGYVVGKGLGKSGEGRVQPVEIKILPAGKSLDVCAEMREKGKVRRAPGTEGESRRRRRRKRRKLVETDGVEEKRVDVFEFLNTKLQSKDTKAESQSVSKPKAGNLNVQLFTVQEEMKSVHKRRQSLQAQLARHKGRDKMMEEHVTEKLSAVDKELGRLQAEERQIEKSLKTKSERKKLRIF